MGMKIRTQHPDPAKMGVNIDKEKYDTIRDVIIGLLKHKGEMSFKELMGAVETQLERDFDGSVGWYFVTVKLDLEARGILTRVAGSRPQKVHLTS
jgi:hypothetical protein